jgi:tetratricopeptide (TPR) repeat protein
VFDANRSTAERLLTLVSRIPGLSATITIRGVAPPIPGTIQIDNLSKLDPDAARSAFLAVAGGLFRDDPDLPHILDALDGHALSVRLVAARAIGSPSLEGLRESWDEAHAELLRISGEEEGRLTSVRASLALSLNSNRMKSTPLARRLMSLLAFLPGGLVDSDVRSLLGERGVVTKLRANEAVVCLHQLRLIESRPDGRLRMLTPLRESVRSDIPPFDVDQRRIIDRYLILAAKGFRIGLRGWETHSADVEAEADNLDSVCELAVTTNITHRDLREALRGLTKFHIFSGRGDIVSVERAAARLHLRPPTPLAATCVQCLGEIALAHSDHEAARACFEDALALHRKTRNKLGEANCIKGLGSIAEARSDQETARARTEEALVLHRSIGNVLGEANCIRSLGGIAKARSDHETARKRYEEAIALYRSIGDILGEANSLRSLGDIAETHYDHEVANAFFEQAMTLYQSIASVLGEANCIQSLAHIRKSRSDYETACAYFEQAIKIYRHIGEKFGEANCIRSLGEIASSRSDFEKAVACLEEALAINRRVGDALGEAHCIHGFGEVALMRLDLDAARAYFEEAKALYMHIGDKLGEANSIQGLGDISWLQSDHESAKLHYIEARELYRRIDDFGGDARSLVKLGHLQRIMFIAAEGLANIEAGFALYFKIADSKDRALPGWQAMYQSLTCDDVSVAQKHRQLARSLWTAIGRLDLVFDWTERA